MNTKTVNDIHDLMEKCRAAESNLATLRQIKEHAAAKYANAETLAGKSAMTTAAIDALASNLSKGRREIDDLGCQIELHEQNLTRL